MFGTNGARIDRDVTLHPPGREKSMAFTALIDETLHHAIAGIARNQDARP